jgi:hypothetical protein
LIRLAVQDQFLECFINDKLNWRTPIASILLIAEYTINEGPHVDDYFVDLWSPENGSLLKAHISFYAAGRDDAFARIAAELKTDLTFGLTGSTEWASRVMWPPPLAGHQYIDFRDIESTNWRDMIARRLLGPTQDCFLTGEVQTFLKMHKRELDNAKNKSD